MSYQEKNITASLVSHILILGYFLIRIFQMVQQGPLISSNIFRLWGTVILLVIVVTIAGTILTQILFAIIEAIKSGGEEPYIDDIEDERDKLVDLKGTKFEYIVYSIGGFIAMLTMVLNQPPLVMFTLFIFFGIVAQITGDISRLYLSKRGF